MSYNVLINGVVVKKEITPEEIQARETYLQSDEYKQIRILELKKQLTDTDYVACKIAEGSATIAEYADLIAERQSWRTQINQLESELNDSENNQN